MKCCVFLSSCHPVIPSSRHPVILSSCHPVILSSCHPVILSSCHPVILSSRHPVPQAMTTIVLFGGPSDERHVSVASAQNIARALAPPTPLCWFWTPEGAVHDVSLAELLAHQRPFE